MIKKKHLAIVIAVILIITYVVSMLGIYRIAKDTAADKFTDYCKQFSQSSFLEPLINLDAQAEDFNDLGVMGIDEFMYESSFEQYYPTFITLFDENSNVAAQKHSMLWFEKDGVSHIVNLEEYLTDEVKKDIEKHITEINDTYFPSILKYNNTGDNIIPVEMIYTEVYSDKTFSIEFTDYRVTDTVDTSDDNCFFHAVFTCYAKDSYEDKCYEYMKAERERYSDSKYTFNEYWNQCTWSDNNEYCENLFTVTLGDAKMYTVYVQLKTDFTHDALNMYNFQQRAIIITVIYAFMTVVLALAYYSYYKNNTRLEKAKYSFTNAAAHELKTPLAVIENQCECILEKVNEEKNGEYVGTIYSESLKMTKLLNNLLQYNKLTLSDSVDKETVNLTEIINEEIEKYKSFAEMKNISVISHLEECTVKCSRELISLVIDNFLSNAIKYSEGSEIKITLEKNNKKYKFSVFNYCQPIKDKKVWEQLYVNSEARNGDSGGLGLAISRQILRLHRYKHGFENKDGGVEFYFIAQ